jgi:hypothetical protein
MNIGRTIKMVRLTAIAGEVLRRYGYETRFSDPSIGSGTVLGYNLRELARLVRINFYHLRNRDQPGDRGNDLQPK